MISFKDKLVGVKGLDKNVVEKFSGGQRDGGKMVLEFSSVNLSESLTS